jgi:hypothetical protein
MALFLWRVMSILVEQYTEYRETSSRLSLTNDLLNHEQRARSHDLGATTEHDERWTQSDDGMEILTLKFGYR